MTNSLNDGQFSCLLTTQPAHIAPKVTWLVLRELALHSSSCHHPIKLWLGEIWLWKPACHLPPLLTHQAAHSKIIWIQSREIVVLKIEILWLSRRREAAIKSREKKERAIRRNETLYWCRKGGWIHWFSVTFCLVTYVWLIYPPIQAEVSL